MINPQCVWKCATVVMYDDITADLLLNTDMPLHIAHVIRSCSTNKACLKHLSSDASLLYVRSYRILVVHTVFLFL